MVFLFLGKCDVCKARILCAYEMKISPYQFHWNVALDTRYMPEHLNWPHIMDFIQLKWNAESICGALPPSICRVHGVYQTASRRAIGAVIPSVPVSPQHTFNSCFACELHVSEHNRSNGANGISISIYECWRSAGYLCGRPFLKPFPSFLCGEQLSSAVSPFFQDAHRTLNCNEVLLSLAVTQPYSLTAWHGEYQGTPRGRQVSM